MFGGLSFTGLPQASSLNNVMPNMGAAEIAAKELVAKKGLPLSVAMPLFNIASGLLNTQDEQQTPMMPPIQIKQGGDYMQQYQDYLKQFGLL